jgi:hypothetical protein
MKPEPDSPSIRRELVAAALFFSVIIVMMKLAYASQDRVMRFLGFSGDQPGGDPPWYFIHQDFAQGLCAFCALIFTLTIVAFAWKALHRYAWTMIWMTWMMQGGSVLRSWIIYRSCPGLLEGDSATTSWTTFNSYLHDERVAFSHAAVLWSGFLLAIAPPLPGLLKRLFERRSTNKDA